MKRIVIKVGTHVLFDEDKMASDRKFMQIFMQIA